MKFERKRNRLERYDYSTPGVYFVTICTIDKQKVFWQSDISEGCEPRLSELGVIVKNYVEKIHEHYPSTSIHRYVIMPNHIHILISLNSVNSEKAPSLTSIVGQLKRNVTKEYGLSVWQKSFHDHIVRNDVDYKKIYEYIENNPLKWELDCFCC